MSKHPYTDDFMELLTTLATSDDFYAKADALAVMGFYVDDRSVPRGSRLEEALGSMMDLFEPTIAECVEEGDYFLSSYSDDLMFFRGGLYRYLMDQVSQDLSVIAQHIWGIDMPPIIGELYSDFAKRLLPELEAQSQKNEILEEVSMSLRTASRTTRKAM